MTEGSGVCLQWPRFGPYHLARLEGVRTLLEPNGVVVHGLETASSDVLYGSMFDTDRQRRGITTVFPGDVLDDLATNRIHRGVQQALDLLNPDAVAINSYSFPDARAAIDWCRRKRRVAILMAESTEADADRSPWREAAKRMIVRGFDAALVGGAPQARYATALGIPPERVFAGYDVVDNAWFASEVAKHRARGAGRDAPADHPDITPPWFMASGRFVPRKNYRMLVEAYRMYRHRSDAPWPLVILGDGRTRETLEHAVRDNGLEGVFTPGTQPFEALPAWYAGAGCFVHAALVEPWGLVVNEAMASGLPVVVSRTTGCAEDLVRNGVNGFTFDPHDADALADLLLRFSSGTVDRARMGAESVRIIDAWTPATFADGLWRAWRAGAPYAPRRYPASTRLVLNGLGLIARNTTSFHATRE